MNEVEYNSITGLCLFASSAYAKSSLRWVVSFVAFLIFADFATLAGPVDIYQDMESGISGELLTSEIAENSSHGYGGTWSINGIMWITNTYQTTLGSPIDVSGTLYNDGGPTRSWVWRDDEPDQYAAFELAPKSSIVVSAFLTSGTTPGLYELHDNINVGIGSVWAVCQVSTEDPVATGLQIEANHGGTVHSQKIEIKQNATYYLTFRVNAGIGLAELNVYNPSDWALIGSVSVEMDTGTLGLVRFGEADSHFNVSPTESYINDIIINWTDTSFPFLPNNLCLSWSPLNPMTYGDTLGPQQLNAAACADGTFVYMPPAGTILDAGKNRSLSVTFTPTDSVHYPPITTNFLININPATLEITATDLSRTYGSENPALAVSYTGFVNGDTPLSLNNPVELATSATIASPTGTYPIIASSASSNNYEIHFIPGTLSITPAPLTIIAENQTKVEGQPNPPLTANYQGFAGSEDSSALDNFPVLTTVATVTSPPGNYPIIVSGASGENYYIEYVDATLTVEANARFAQIELMMDGGVTVHVTGKPGRIYRVQVSSDLDSWNDFVALQMDDTGQGTITESAGLFAGNRFFRIIWP